MNSHLKCVYQNNHKYISNFACYDETYILHANVDYLSLRQLYDSGVCIVYSLIEQVKLKKMGPGMLVML